MSVSTDSMNPPPRVLLRSEETDGRIALIESTMPAGAAGPPLHTHAFDETFFVLEGELTFQVGGEVRVARAGEVAFALGGVPHALANQSAGAARFLVIFAPAGFEREFARRAAAIAGVDPPVWAQRSIPEVTVVGPRVRGLESGRAPQRGEAPHDNERNARSRCDRSDPPGSRRHGSA
jgi:quercetin dioxygenase-like cupin family protein